MIGRIYAEELYQVWQSNKDIRVIDVRTPEEYREVRAKGVIHVPLDEISAKALVAKGVQPSDRVYMICRSGARSQRACEMLQQEGYQNLTNVEGGTLAWIEAGLPHELGQS
ncbi:MAG: rhodanese-like domain-containing protein [Oligoflexus sp.]